MESFDFILSHVAETIQTTPKVVADVLKKAGVLEQSYEPAEVPVWDPMGLSEEQGQQAVVEHVKRKEAMAEVIKQDERLTRVVQKAMGQTQPEARPTTEVEPRESLQAAIKTVGHAGRKGVFSELPFEAEDVPEGWEVIRTKDGGYLTTPPEHLLEALENEEDGQRYKTLGYVAPKSPEDEVVVQVKKPNGVSVQDVSTSPSFLGDAIRQAQEIAQSLKGAFVDITNPQAALEDRAQAVSQEVSDDIFQSYATVEGKESKAYPDTGGNITVGVGFNMDQEGARDIWKSAGVQKDFDAVHQGKQELSDEEIKALLGVTLMEAGKKAQTRAKALGVKWDSLPSWHREILTDLAFNVKGISQWSQVFTSKNPKAVLRAARRQDGGKWTKGMDNRVTRIGLRLGIVNSVRQARLLGLEKADLPKDEEAALIRKAQKSKPTVDLL